MPPDLLQRPVRAAVPGTSRTAPKRRTRVFALTEARWAAAALVLFLVALPLQLADASGWLWGPLYAAAYVAGGWEPAWAGLTALREKTLDVDLLMIVAAIGAASIGQVMDGAARKALSRGPLRPLRPAGNAGPPAPRVRRDAT
ncbi:hypothetical protein AB0L94_37385, partial [Streptomyces sp. NPDC051993]